MIFLASWRPWRFSILLLVVGLWLAPGAFAASVAIDVGHYLKQPGVISARGVPEFEYNRALALEIDEALRRAGHKTLLIGADGLAEELATRGPQAKGMDLFISVHHDSVQARYLSVWEYEGAERHYSDRRGICPSCGGRRMAETAAWLVDHVIPKVPVRQWVLSFPIPLRSLFAMHPELLAPVLQIIHRVIATHLIRQAGVKRSAAATGAVTLIQRFGSAANLNIHLHGLVLDGVYCATGEGVPVFHRAPALTGEKLQALLGKIITRILRVLTREGHLVEEEGVTYVVDAHGIIDPDNLLAPLQAAPCT